MNRSARILVAAVTVFTVVACRKDDTVIKTTSTGETNLSASADSADARGHSMVRIVNVGNGGKDVALQLGDQTLFDNVKASTVTDYREVAANLAQFSARTRGSSDTAALARNDQILMDGNRYTIFLIAEDLTHNTLRIVKDDVIPDSGMTRIRVVHAAPGGPELDISVANAKDKLFSGVNFKSEAGYTDIDPARVVLEVRGKDEKKVLLRLPAMNLKRGTATTVVITGASRLGAFTFIDAMVPAPRK
jgi:hypothetical protein